MTGMLLMIGTTELILIGGLVLLLFGGKKLPEMMRGLGQGVKNFKEGMNEPTADHAIEDGKEQVEDGLENIDNNKKEEQ